MRIARYATAGGESVGLVFGDRVVNVGELDGDLADDSIAILEGGPSLWQRLEDDAADRAGMPLGEVQLLAPIRRPAKFLGVGMNSHDHAQEMEEAEPRPELEAMAEAQKHLKAAFPEPRFPMLFNKQTSSIAGPHDAILIPHDSDQVDYEGEVVVVIGRRVRRADDDEAAAAIGGWTVTNDVSVRDWQWDTSQMWLGKSFDSHGPIGPWIVTADEFDPFDAVIRTWVNGELRQEGRLEEQIISATRLVSLISQVCTLEPGDLIATGTPGGIGTFAGNYLVPGDRVRVAVTGIGEIENEVAEEPVPVGAEAPGAAA